MRTVEVTITQTESFTIYLDVSENATSSDIEALAEQVRNMDDILSIAYPNSDTDTVVSSIEEANPSFGTFVYNVNEDGLDERRVGE